MKNRLDLINLLQKYQKGKFVSSQYDNNENNEFPKTQYNQFLKNNNLKTQERNDKMQRNYDQNLLNKKAQIKTFSNQYYMARSQCQKNLQKILNQLNFFETRLTNILKENNNKIQKQIQQQILIGKKYIIDTVNQIFSTQIKRQKEIFYSNYTDKNFMSFEKLNKKIIKEKEEIKKLISNLNQKQYKSIIAQIVVKDFDKSLQQIGSQLQHQICYEFKEVICEIDQNKINCISNDLKNLFLQFNSKKFNTINRQSNHKIASKYQKNTNDYGFQQSKEPDQYKNNLNNHLKLKNKQLSQRSVRRKSIFQRSKKQESQSQQDYNQNNLNRYSENKNYKKSFFNFSSKETAFD